MLELFAIILVTVAFFYLFVCVDSYGKGALPKIKRFLFETLPNTLRAIGTKICGKRAVKCVDGTARYICYEPNPLVQIVYFVCAFGGFYVYVQDGFPRVPNKHVAGWHKVTGTLLMIMCYTSYFLACYVDPGNLRKGVDHGEHLKALKRFKPDGIMFEKKNKCRTCEFEKPARSKHCPMCKACVQKFDHHCVWIN